MQTLASSEPESVSIEVLGAISQHSDPYLAWSDEKNVAIVVGIASHASAQVMDAFVADSVVPRMKALPPSQKTTPAGYAARRTLGGLKPRLGFNESSLSKIDHDLLAMIYFCISCQNIGSWYSSRWSIVTSFILKAMDEPSASKKLQACQILCYFLLFPDAWSLLQRTGLHELFAESTKVCLTYVPGLTSMDESLALLDIAYDVMFQLQKESVQKMLDILLGILRSLVSKIDEPEVQKTYRFPILLLQKLRSCMEALGHSYVASLSRVNYTLQQVIVNPGVAEHHAGDHLINQVIQVQIYMLETAQKYDQEGQQIVASYALDMVGAWIVAQRRAPALSVTQTIQKAFEMLKTLPIDPEVDEAVTAVATKYSIAF